MSPLISDSAGLVFVALAAVVPLVVVLVFAIVRGYTIDLHMTRDIRRGWRRPRDNGDDEA